MFRTFLTVVGPTGPASDISDTVEVQPSGTISPVRSGPQDANDCPLERRGLWQILECGVGTTKDEFNDVPVVFVPSGQEREAVLEVHDVAA